MKKLVLLWLLFASASAAETLRMAVTTSFNNSGLADILLPAIKADTGIDLALIVVGTGQALRLGEAGDVDAVLVHARAAEDAFLAAGYGQYRLDIMYNDFVIIGPADDPAHIADAPDARAALAAIAAAGQIFVSRGDESGTHKKELSLWAVPPSGAWYRAAGAGMGATLNLASGMGAYALTDRASWLNFGNKAGLVLLFSGDPALFNPYSYIPVSPARWPHINAEAAVLLGQWLTSPRAAGLINGYRLQGQPLFTATAQ